MQRIAGKVAFVPQSGMRTKDRYDRKAAPDIRENKIWLPEEP
jgi:hypothetical protein